MEWSALELDDDPALLDAALLMLDTLDGGEGVSSTTSLPDSVLEAGTTSGSSDGEELRSEHSEKTTPSASSTAIVTPPKINKSRNRRKEELALLQDTIKQLETTLSTLKRRRVEDERAVVPLRGRQALWKQLAGRQQQQRRAVEKENARLRDMLNTQLQVSKELMRLVQKVGRVNPNTRLPYTPRPSVHIAGLTDAQRLARVDELHRLTCHQVLAVPMDVSGAAVSNTKIYRESPQMTLVKFVTAWSVPFSTMSVLDTVWKLYADPSVNLTRHNLDNETAGGFRLHPGIQAPRIVPGEIAGRKASKRFLPTANGDGVILSSMSAQCIPEDASSEVPFSQVQFYEDSWTRVRTLDQVWTDEPLTQIQINRQMRFHVVLEDEDEQERVMEMLKKIALAYVEEEVLWKQQVIENVLFAQS
ncbi:hypothetical protein Poli38472_004914 [Pythium oligandrum]|uniref:Uncharacterized protein n=1 Tax=Pythium oligandrum TaxID=41045 RepID=A0A8K1CB33_PYTOL|nr:hypothetical protein Poli38472_004914 [Pythium oligandrum]|eukprot:TMW59845.1 hypothetical protein Poli38472_004914 [Pythium oligandrum]